MKKLLAFFTIILITGVLAYYNSSFLLSQYAQYFTISNGKKGANAIVVLSGGLFTRLPYALDLMDQNYAPQLLMSEERKPYIQTALNSLKLSNAENAERIMTALNRKYDLVEVNSSKGGATSTFDEAYDLLRYSKENQFERIIIVTDAFHTRRALYAFQKVFEGSSIQVEALGAPNSIFNEKNWWQSDAGISAYVLEGIKYPVYRFTRRNVSFVKNY